MQEVVSMCVLTQQETLGPVSHLAMNSATSLSTNDNRAGRKEISFIVRCISLSMKSLQTLQ